MYAPYESGFSLLSGNIYSRSTQCYRQAHSSNKSCRDTSAVSVSTSRTSNPQTLLMQKYSQVLVRWIKTGSDLFGTPLRNRTRIAQDENFLQLRHFPLSDLYHCLLYAKQIEGAMFGKMKRPEREEAALRRRGNA